MKIRVLGCSGGIGAGLRTTSYLIDDDILLDAGTGVGDLTDEEMSKIRHVFLTHSHLDHVTSLPLLVDSIFDHIKEPLVVHAQAATIDVLKTHFFNWDIWPDFAELPTRESAVMTYKAIKPGEIHEISGRTFEVIPVNHIVPTVGYRIVSPKGGVFAFSGDTTTNDTFWAALNAHDRLDLLFVEVAFEDAHLELSKLSRHYCPQLLADDLKKLNHHPSIYLTHFNPGREREEAIYKECLTQLGSKAFKRLAANDTFDL
ncbi:MAG: 3',5'-cyclic-nucleotide phosphodiesterase [Gammaproteobacteria bacterium]|nr:3',5'-cyclic-nucleotide phosphodiesterase [Gammaproteobacteria bacterium]MDH5594489.1 3',5'-cyclic-nucleotide phosphodiesterase [Gammaproteobacteria bacterium]MDH5614354.1 3',5'-cyclic-nucleotide phosphodiesterase [Gammaproteobacteria bacterium]